MLLFVMGYKAFFVLKAIVQAGKSNKINHVVIGTDPHVLNDYSNIIADFLAENKIDYSFRGEHIPHNHHLAIAIGWKWIISNQAKLIVLHDSLLPLYRGFNPMVTQLIDGVEKIGVSAILASVNYDEGDIVCQESIEINYPIKIKEAIEKVSICCARCIDNIMLRVESGDIQGTPQDHTLATYSVWRDEEDYLIDWTQDSGHVKRFIDSVSYPYSGAKTFMNGIKIVIYESDSLPYDLKIHNRDPGKVIKLENGFPIIICGKGLIKIKEAQYIENMESCLPLPKFRVRMHSF